MRHATWIALEASPVWRKMYGAYRKLPAAARSPIRWVTMPRWHAATTLIQVASGKKVVAGPFRGMRLELSELPTAITPSGWRIGHHAAELLRSKPSPRCTGSLNALRY